MARLLAFVAAAALASAPSVASESQPPIVSDCASVGDTQFGFLRRNMIAYVVGGDRALTIQAAMSAANGPAGMQADSYLVAVGLTAAKVMPIRAGFVCVKPSAVLKSGREGFLRSIGLGGSND